MQTLSQGPVIRRCGSLRKRPGFSLTVALTLGLGIGATTAIFSVVNAVLLRPLPYADAGPWSSVWGELRARNVHDWPFSNPDFADLRAQTTTFDGLAAVATGRNAVPGPRRRDDHRARRRTSPRTSFLCSGFRSRVAVISRTPTVAAAPCSAPRPAAGAAGRRRRNPPHPRRRSHRSVILSHEFWQRLYGGDPNIVGSDRAARPAVRLKSSASSSRARSCCSARAPASNSGPTCGRRCASTSRRATGTTSASASWAG